MEVDSGSKSSTLFLRWHNPVYGLSACGILSLKIWKVGQSGAVPRSFSAGSLLVNFFKG